MDPQRHLLISVFQSIVFLLFDMRWKFAVKNILINISFWMERLHLMNALEMVLTALLKTIVFIVSFFGLFVDSCNWIEPIKKMSIDLNWFESVTILLQNSLVCCAIQKLIYSHKRNGKHLISFKAQKMEIVIEYYSIMFYWVSG